MDQMELYYVVRRTKEKDEEFAVIDAMSLDEANAIFEVRHKADREAMEEGESFFIFHEDEAPKFDDKNRIIFPSGTMTFIHKIS